jgi:hypothetical protein
MLNLTNVAPPVSRFLVEHSRVKIQYEVRRAFAANPQECQAL